MEAVGKLPPSASLLRCTTSAGEKTIQTLPGMWHWAQGTGLGRAGSGWVPPPTLQTVGSAPEHHSIPCFPRPVLCWKSKQ